MSTSSTSTSSTPSATTIGTTPGTGQSADATGTLTMNRPTDAPVAAANQESQPNNNNQSSEGPETLESALEQLKQLRAKRDSLLAQKAKDDKAVEQLTKKARIAHLKTLIPRELYNHQDAYENEVQRVYEWRNVSDADIADIFKAKLASYDAGRSRATATKQHSASSSVGGFPNIFSNFKDVPQFREMASSASQEANKANSEKIKNLMKRIGSNSSGSVGSTRVE